MLANGESKTERRRKREVRQSQNDVVSGSVNNHSSGGSTVTLEDREVDEFFAILRRMHTAVNNLKKADGVNGVNCVLTERGADDGNGVNVGVMVRGREAVAENVGLDFDLNADPGHESDPV